MVERSIAELTAGGRQEAPAERYHPMLAVLHMRYLGAVLISRRDLTSRPRNSPSSHTQVISFFIITGQE